MRPEGDGLDCLVIGGGPAGLTAALYFARFRRRFLVIDAGRSRAAWIPISHNLPFFAEGISGKDILRRQREHAEQYGACILDGTVGSLQLANGLFIAGVEETGGEMRYLSARHVLLATGAVDIEPALPDVPDAVRRGLVRYCPICDGYESRDRKIAVLGHGASGIGEASFVARTYSDNVTLLTLGEPMHLNEDARHTIEKHRIRIVRAPIVSLQTGGTNITATTSTGEAMQFDVLYSALGLRHETGLACALGAEHDTGANLVVDEHNETTVKGLYAAGAIVRGLDQIVIAMGHAAVAATAIHNRCELPTNEER